MAVLASVPAAPCSSRDGIPCREDGGDAAGQWGLLLAPGKGALPAWLPETDGCAKCTMAQFSESPSARTENLTFSTSPLQSGQFGVFLVHATMQPRQN